MPLINRSFKILFMVHQFSLATMTSNVPDELLYSTRPRGGGLGGGSQWTYTGHIIGVRIKPSIQYATEIWRSLVIIAKSSLPWWVHSCSPQKKMINYIYLWMTMLKFSINKKKISGIVGIKYPQVRPLNKYVPHWRLIHTCFFSFL